MIAIPLLSAKKNEGTTKRIIENAPLNVEAFYCIDTAYTVKSKTNKQGVFYITTVAHLKMLAIYIMFSN